MREIDEQLFRAVKARSIPEVEQALAQGADINAIGEDGLTPLRSTLYSTPLDQDLILRLLAAGADPNIYKPDDSPPLITLVMEQNHTLIQAALAAGASVDAVGRSGQGLSALEWAVLFNDEVTIQTLIKAGAQIERHGMCGMTCLMLGSLLGKSPAVAALLDLRASVHATDEFGRTALCHAVRTRPVVLTEKIRDLEPTDPIYAQAELAYECVVEMLLFGESDPDVQDLQGLTPLMLAAEGGRTKTVQRLIKRGCRLDLKDHEGRTALDIAREVGHWDAAVLLEEAAGGSP